MFNPLRCPIVLIALFAVMVGYVHMHHRRATRRDASMSDQVGRVNLRGTERKGVRASIVRTMTTSSSRDKHAAMAISHTGRSHAVPLPSSFKRAVEVTRSTESDAATEPKYDPSQIVPARDNQIRDRSDRKPSSWAPARIEPTAAPSFEIRPTDRRPAPPQQVTASPARTNPQRETPAYTRRYNPREEQSSRVVMHRIVDGDTLRKLAERYLHDESRYLEIFQANQHLLVHEELLPLGERLRIPIDGTR